MGLCEILTTIKVNATSKSVYYAHFITYYGTFSYVFKVLYYKILHVEESFQRLKAQYATSFIYADINLAL